MNVETALLGAVLTDNRAWYDADVRGDEFESPSLGIVWDGIGSVVAKGERLDAFSVAAHFPAWGVKSLNAASPYEWTTDGGLTPFLAAKYAASIRQSATRRLGREVMTAALEQLGDTGNDPESVLTDVSRRFTEGQRVDEQIEAHTLRAVLETTDEYQWVIPDLLEARDRLILTGAEGLGKSTMARQLMLLPAAGIHPFTFTPIEPVQALVIDAENTQKQWKRNSTFLRELTIRRGGTDPADSVHIATSGRVNLLDPRVVGSIHRLIDRVKPKIVFIGPLYRLAVKFNSDEDAAPVIAALDEIRDRGVALVMEAHSGHALGSGGIRDVRPRGSSALMGWPEFGFGIRSNQENPDLYDFIPWRGAREANRKFPVTLRKGPFDRRFESADFPWLPVEMPT